MSYCCEMRARFLISIVHEFLEAPQPKDLVDFLDFDQKDHEGKPILRIKYCPFCGVAEPKGPLRVPKSAREEGEEWKDGKKDP